MVFENHPGTIGEGSTDARGTSLFHGRGESGPRTFCGEGIATAGVHHGAAWTVGLNQRPDEGFGFHHGRLPERGPPYLVPATIGGPMARTLPDPRPTAGLKDPVLVEHDGVVVCAKPSGLPSSGRTLDDPWSLQALLMVRRRRAKVWAVHQLDQQTSGLNVFALRKPRVAEAAAWLQDGTKTYLAVVSGRLLDPAEVTAPIGRIDKGGRRVAALTPTGRPARSSVVPLAVGKDASLVSVRLHTGRTHQARLHLAHLGHPLLGERLHAPAPCRRHPRHALHAWRLDLPAAPGPLQCLEAPLPFDLLECCAARGLRLPDSAAPSG